MSKKEWFENWFDSKFYHLLYNHRNYSEANFFIEHLCSTLQLQEGDRIWDMACGRGRHAIAFSKKGFDVTGSDLSGNNIRSASQHQNSHLHFQVHDMREPLKEKYFQCALNLFTSIGYFSDIADNYRVFQAVSESLVKGGSFVLDFFNAEKVRRMKDTAYEERRGDLVFRIDKKIVADAVQKQISFESEGIAHRFTERVSLLGADQFRQFAEKAGLKIRQVFGSYHLEPFDPENSDRLIIIFRN